MLAYDPLWQHLTLTDGVARAWKVPTPLLATVSVKGEGTDGHVCLHHHACIIKRFTTM